MECNKDEAKRAKEIALKKFADRDFAGARKLALKAQALYPQLEGLTQLITMFDVYISAEKEVNGEIDWYAVLDVDPFDDAEKIKNQYHKLALMLHPDKNKNANASGAFKLVSEGWRLLSDKTKRHAYNQKRNLCGYSGGPVLQPRANWSHNYTSGGTSSANTQNCAEVGPAAASEIHEKKFIFWTACKKCNKRYEYLRGYLNSTVRCSNCQETFVALEKTESLNVSKPMNLFAFQSHGSSSQHVTDNAPCKPQRAPAAQYLRTGVPSNFYSFPRTSFQIDPTKSVFSDPNVKTKVSTAQATCAVYEADKEVSKRAREEILPTAECYNRCHDFKKVCGGHSTIYSGPSSTSIFKEDWHSRKHKVNNSSSGYGISSGCQVATSSRIPAVQSVSGLRESSGKARKGEALFGNNDTLGKLVPLEIKNMLMQKARKEIKNKLKEWSSASEAEAAAKAKTEEKGKNIATAKNNFSRKDLEAKKFRHGSSDKMGQPAPAVVTMEVPDSDFHDFDMDRTESVFCNGQVWAAYDDEDGMPRYYAIIHEVLSSKPFKMTISWLNSRSNSELGPLAWTKSGFPKTCGEFRVGRHQIYDSLTAFSHIVKWEKGKRGAICIYPRKGDVWALYRNWSPDWSEQTPNHVIHKYDMVKVLQDYNDVEGVLVTPLSKLAGFRTLFSVHADPKEVRRIPREEMFRLSHQVTARCLTSEEFTNAPEGCLELDPAAIPLELLQILPQLDGTSVKENDGVSIQHP